MDPEKALQDAQAHLRDGALAEAEAALAAYWDWREQGGRHAR